MKLFAKPFLPRVYDTERDELREGFGIRWANRLALVLLLAAVVMVWLLRP